MKAKRAQEKPETPADRARKLLARAGARLDASQLAAALRDLLDEDPGNLNGQFMLGLFLRFPEMSPVLRRFVAPQLVGPLSRELRRNQRNAAVDAAFGIDRRAEEKRLAEDRKALDALTGKGGKRPLFGDR